MCSDKLAAARNMEADCSLGAGAGFGKYTREVAQRRRVVASPAMEIFRVVITRQGEWFVAGVIEQDIVHMADSVFEAIEDIGKQFDAMDAQSAAPLPSMAPADFLTLWDAGIDLGEVPLGKRRRGRVRFSCETSRTPIRVLILRDGPAYIAAALGCLVAATGASLFDTIRRVGRELDHRGNRPLEAASVQQEQWWTDAVTLGRVELGAKRHWCEIRMAVSRV